MNLAEEEKNNRKNPILLLSTSILALLLFGMSIPVVAASTPASGGSTYGIYSANPQRVAVSATASTINGVAPYCSVFLFCYPPSYLKVAYNFPPTTGPNGLNGAGQTIVIVDAFGSPTLQNDINIYDSTFGLPATTVTILCGPTWTGSASDKCPTDVPGSPLDLMCGEEGWAFETTLDVSMAHSMAPGANIVLVIANSCQDTALNSAEAAVVAQPNLKGSIMSQSFGEPDPFAGCSTLSCTTYNHAVVNAGNAIYSLAAANHWTVLASSGDDGANEALSASGGTITGLMPSWPATSPLVLAVGGTQGFPYSGQYNGKTTPASCPALKTCNTGLVLINGGLHGCGTGTFLLPACTPVGYGGEGTWNEANFYGTRTASGGGVSSIYSLPSWQSSLPGSFSTILGSTVAATGRLTPDVSFNAAVNGGLLNYDGFVSIFGGPNGFYILAGTSAASPAWAGIIALVNQKVGHSVGYINPAIYAIGTSSAYNFVFHDITQGNNSDTAGSFGVDGFSASSGWDMATGWGTPNVGHLIQAVASTQTGS